MLFSLFVTVLTFLLCLQDCSSTSLSVVGLVRGRRYEVTAETVEEFTRQVEGLAGLEMGEQSVLFRGKVLNSSDRLEDVGVSSGDVLNVLKGRKPSSSSSSMTKEEEDLTNIPRPEDFTSSEAYSEAMKNVVMLSFILHFYIVISVVFLYCYYCYSEPRRNEERNECNE